MSTDLMQIPPRRSEDYAYRMGLDCARNGANTTNCHFAIFATPALTAAWERGKRDGDPRGETDARASTTEGA